MIKRAIDENLVKGLLPRRPKDANKGTFGRVLILGGSDKFPGAPHLAAIGAARVGAGLITIATIPSVRLFTAQKNLEFTYLVLSEKNGFIAPDSFKQIVEEIPKVDVLLIGPGLGISEETKSIMKQLIKQKKLPKVVIDADGLNVLSQINNWWNQFGDSVLTPHPGEMSKLTNLSIEVIQINREKVALEYAKKWNKVLVLKGANTFIANPQGEQFISEFENPLLATAGTGDVLAGMIAGFLAQGLSLFDGAKVGVYIHGRAGESLKEKQGDAGAIASDLLPLIPQTIKKMKIV